LLDASLIIFRIKEKGGLFSPPGILPNSHNVLKVNPKATFAEIIFAGCGRMNLVT
jgi:hypothetical protein